MTELDRVVGSERMPTWDDEPSLPYVRSLIKEIHRYNPIASLGPSLSANSLPIPCQYREDHALRDHIAKLVIIQEYHIVP